MQPNVLMLTHTWSLLPTSTQHAYVCSAGSLGYHALKEMLQNGIPGSTVLLESGDLREVASPTPPSCCLVYTAIFTPQTIYRAQLHRSATHIAIYTNLDTLPYHLLQYARHLHTVNLTPLSHITQLPMSFLHGCSGLITQDLRPLWRIKTVPACFMYACSGVTSLDLSPLSNVEKIERLFLFCCTGLTSIDLSPLSNVRVVGDFFLADCTGLTSLDLSPLSPHRWSEIPPYFLRNCSGLKTLTLLVPTPPSPPAGSSTSPLPSSSCVQKVNRAFLQGCSSLVAIDLSILSTVTEIKEFFLCGCTGLTAIDLSPLSNVQEVQCYFLKGCGGLMALDMAPMSQLTTIHTASFDDEKASFLEGCSCLSSIGAPPLCPISPPCGWVIGGPVGCRGVWKRKEKGPCVVM
jgi:hypothetical protein